MIQTNTGFRNKQGGAALFTALIFLLILAILGISSMNDTIMQGKMAAAIQDGNVALQGAETAVREAERTIDGLASIGDFNPSSNGLYDQGSAPDPFLAATWASTDSLATGAVAGQGEEPRYFIELAGEIQEEDNELVLNLDSYSHESGGGSIIGFRIVARATGGTTNSQRIIETYYGRRF